MKNPARGKTRDLRAGSPSSQKKPPINPLEEPVEIVKTALEQVGARPPREPESLINGSKVSEQQSPSPEERRKASMLQAFREELREIEKLQKKRQKEMRQRWHEAEEVKKQREEEAKKAHKPLFEPATKVKRGILGGAGRMFGLGKKQRQVEIGKTPTN